MTSLLEERDGVLVFSPERVAEARAHGGRAVAYIPVGVRSDGWFVADGAYDHVGIVADAYASDEETLAAAIAFVRTEERDAGRSGPLRLTYLGSLGEWRPLTAPPIGRAVEVTGRIVIGRAPTSAIVLRQGAHSDQNTVARIHTIVEPTANGVVVTDAQSSNGTWLCGRRIDKSEATIGDEIAVACTHRFRIDGTTNAKSPTP